MQEEEKKTFGGNIIKTHEDDLYEIKKVHQPFLYLDNSLSNEN